MSTDEHLPIVCAVDSGVPSEVFSAGSVPGMEGEGGKEFLLLRARNRGLKELLVWSCTFSNENVNCRFLTFWSVVDFAAFFLFVPKVAVMKSLYLVLYVVVLYHNVLRIGDHVDIESDTLFQSGI